MTFSHLVSFLRLFPVRDRGPSFRGSGVVALHHYRPARQARSGFDLGAGACHGGRNGHARLHLSCDWKEVSTGIEMDHATVNQLDLAKVFCPHCRQPHHMVGVEYWLSQVDEPAPLEEAAEAA